MCLNQENVVEEVLPPYVCGGHRPHIAVAVVKEFPEVKSLEKVNLSAEVCGLATDVALNGWVVVTKC